MSELKITKGKFRVNHIGDLMIDMAHGRSRCFILPDWFGIDQREANAHLICEAFNVTNQTGLTPKQLLEQRDELMKCLGHIDACMDEMVVNADLSEAHSIIKTQLIKHGGQS